MQALKIIIKRLGQMNHEQITKRFIQINHQK
jgi:hypothetical protein